MSLQRMVMVGSSLSCVPYPADRSSWHVLKAHRREGDSSTDRRKGKSERENMTRRVFWTSVKRYHLNELICIPINGHVRIFAFDNDVLFVNYNLPKAKCYTAFCRLVYNTCCSSHIFRESWNPAFPVQTSKKVYFLRKYLNDLSGSHSTRIKKAFY